MYWLILLNVLIYSIVVNIRCGDTNIRQRSKKQDDSNCMNVPSNVKWKIFYMHFCFCCFILFFFLSWEAQKDGALHVSGDHDKETVSDVFVSAGCSMQQRPTVNLGNDPNLPHEVYQYVIDTHFCFELLFSGSQTKSWHVERW